ncbi:MAG: ComF family protein [Butyricicoccus sp.]
MSLKQLWFPSVCAACGAELRDGEHIVCRACLEREEYRLTAPFSVRGADDADAPLVYKGAVRRAMHAYKFQSRRAYANGFAAYAEECLRTHLDAWQPDVMTFVPLSPRRWMKRGYNQSALVARLVAEACGLPCEPMLCKRLGVPVQSEQPHDQRAENIRDAFRVRRNAGIAGRRVLLVDDIVTTGETAAACAQVLRGAGASAVYVLSMTKTPVFRR